MPLATFIVVILVIILIGFVAFRLVKDSPDRAELARLQTRDQDFQNTTILLQEKTRTCESLQIEKTRLEADLANERRATAEKLELLDDSEARLKTEFENLANRIFEDKGKILTEQNRERISGLLQPFKEQLESFPTRVDEVHRQDTELPPDLMVNI